MKRLLIGIIVAAGVGWSQPSPPASIVQVTSDPSGACTVGTAMQLNVTNGHQSYCQGTPGSAGTWATISGGGGGAVSSVFTRTGAVIAASGDYTAAQVTNAADTSSTYSNPGWITALAYAKLTGAPAIPTVTGGTCTNQAVTAISNSAVPTCTTITSTYVNNSIALTGTDVNTSNQVTATHLAVGLPRAQGGLNSTSAGTGLFRDGSTPTASEISGDATTSGSNALTLATVNSNIGTCGDATHVGQVTLNAKGLATACSAVTISGAGTTAASNVTSVTATANTTSDQSLQELTLTSGVLNVLAAPFLIHGSGIFTIAAIQTPALTFKVKLCTVSGCGSGTVVTLASIVTGATVAATNNPWNINLKMATASTGASGTVLVHGPLVIDTAATATVAEVVFNDTNTAASSAINLTGVLYIDFTVATSAGNSGNSFTQQIATLEPASSQGPAGAVGAGGATVLISQQTIGSAVATVTFSSISGYTNLKLVAIARCSAATGNDDMYIQFNTDTGSNYLRQYILASGSATPTAGQATSAHAGPPISCASALANTAGSAVFEIPNYAGAVFFKYVNVLASYHSSTTAASFSSIPLSIYWANTNAITSITLGVAGGSNFITGSSFTLYGEQ